MKTAEAEYLVTYTDHEDIMVTSYVLTFSHYVPQALGADHISTIKNFLYREAGENVELMAITRA